MSSAVNVDIHVVGLDGGGGDRYVLYFYGSFSLGVDNHRYSFWHLERLFYVSVWLVGLAVDDCVCLVECSAQSYETVSQGVAIAMNTFFGVIVNAAYGIAGQISGQLQNFTATISKAMNPQIMQRAGAGDKDGMISLSMKQCKYASILLSYAIIPLLFSI